MEDNLKEKTAKGLLWGGLNSGVQQLVGMASGIILGRLLTPSDYGMMAMISIFSLVATTLQDSGFRTALTNLRNPRPEDYNSVFWFNIVMGVSLYALLFACAPLIGQFYHNARVVPLCRYAFLSIVLASLGTAQSAWLFRHLRAKQQAQAAAVAVVASNIVGIGMAMMGMAYWALATQGLVYVGINTLCQWRFSPWRPSLHGISMSPVRRMFGFSSKILATSIMTNVNNNVLNITLGHYFSDHDTGNYNQASQWNTKCYSLVQSMVAQVAQPVLAGLDGDGRRQLEVFRKMMRFTAFVSFPLLLGFGLVAKEFITLALTDKWEESAGLIQILCVSGAVSPLATLCSNMIISKGKSGTFFWCTFTLGAALTCMTLCLWPLGIRSMVIGFVTLNTAWLCVWLWFVRRLSGYTYGMFLRDVMPYALAAGAVMAAVHVVTASIESMWLLLLTRTMLAAACYAAVMWLKKETMLGECVAFLRKSRKKK